MAEKGAGQVQRNRGTQWSPREPVPQESTCKDPFCSFSVAPLTFAPLSACDIISLCLSRAFWKQLNTFYF